MQADKYNYEHLGGGVYACVSEAHSFGTDAFLLADFAAPRRRERALDLCSGCGIIPLLWLRDAQNRPKETAAVDIMPGAIEQMLLGRGKSGLEEQLSPQLCDIREPTLLGHATWDLITCNPPYFKSGAGYMSQSNTDKAARHETMCTLNEVCKTASWLLKFGGRFCLCHLPERLTDVLCAMRENKIEPKRMRFIQQREGSAPWLVLIEGKRGAKPSLAIMPPLIMEDENGGRSPELQRIYSEYIQGDL